MRAADSEEIFLLTQTTCCCIPPRPRGPLSWTTGGAEVGGGCSNKSACRPSLLVLRVSLHAVCELESAHCHKNLLPSGGPAMR